MQAIVSEAVEGWDCEAIYVGASGNFTIERVLRGKVLHSNDVTLYSCAIGWYLAGEDFRLELRKGFKTEWGWLRRYMRDPVGKLAVVMLSSEMLQGVGRANAYYDRLRASYRKQWGRLYSETRARIEGIDLHLSSFHAGDVVDWLLKVPDDAGFVVFPPFFAGDYEQMFRPLDQVFDWDEPTYPELDEDRMQVLIERIQSKRFWLYGNNQRRPDLEEFLRGRVQTTNRGVPIWLYSNAAPVRLVRPAQKVEALPVPHLLPGETLGGRLEVARISEGQFVTLRSSYMNKAIRPGSPSMAYAVLVDGALVGAFAVFRDSLPSRYARQLPSPGTYLMSDFPVSGTDYPRLAKLVLYAVLSLETKRDVEQVLGGRIRSITTTAFTDRPVSMKYRGLFDLLGRRDSTDPDYAFQLQYGSEMGRWTLQEGYEEWQTRHGSTSN